MNHTIEINGRMISYNKIGTGGRNAVLLHGWGASKAWWYPIGQGLADSYTCYAPDLLGFGQSTKPAEREEFQIEQQAAVIAAFIERLGLGPVYLIGHSMGGMISVTLAYFYPHLVERLAVFDLVVTGRCGSFLRASQIGLAVPLVGRWLFNLGYTATQWTLGTYRRSFKLMLARQVGREQEAFIARTYPDYRTLPLRSLEYAMKAFTGFDLRPFMAGVKQPTLVVCGKEDRQIPPEDSQLLADALPDSRLEWFSPAGHNPFVEYPENCLLLLKTFANGSGESRALSLASKLHLNGSNEIAGRISVDKSGRGW